MLDRCDYCLRTLDENPDLTLHLQRHCSAYICEECIDASDQRILLTDPDAEHDRRRDEELLDVYDQVTLDYKSKEEP